MNKELNIQREGWNGTKLVKCDGGSGFIGLGGGSVGMDGGTQI